MCCNKFQLSFVFFSVWLKLKLNLAFKSSARWFLRHESSVLFVSDSSHTSIDNLGKLLSDKCITSLSNSMFQIHCFIITTILCMFLKVEVVSIYIRVHQLYDHFIWMKGSFWSLKLTRRSYQRDKQKFVITFFVIIVNKCYHVLKTSIQLSTVYVLHYINSAVYVQIFIILFYYDCTVITFASARIFNKHSILPQFDLFRPIQPYTNVP